MKEEGDNLLNLKEKAFKSGSFATYLFLNNEIEKIKNRRSKLAIQRLDLGNLFILIIFLQFIS